MRQTVTLEVAPAAARDDDGIRLLVSPRGQVELAPGAYSFEVTTTTDSSSASPMLVAIDAQHQTSDIPLQKVSDTFWRGAATFSGTIVTIVTMTDSRRHILRCRISTLSTNLSLLPAPLREISRAIYRRSPRVVRRWTRALAHNLRRTRQARGGRDVDSFGEIRLIGGTAAIGSELAAHRADFDARFAVARGIDEKPKASESPPPRARAQLIAFYLPQFHRIPENDAWWGAGFTEWTNVVKAVPQFLGHYQPRFPSELGFYDLTAPDVLRRQVTLAAEYDVSAFCFHYYWFSGKRLLERPLDAFLRSSGLNLGFTLCWANENWTRRWDGAEEHVLIDQRHTPEDHARVFDDMARYLEDDRCIRIEGKPLLIVYRPGVVPNAREMTMLWRERAHRRGWPGVYIAATDAFEFEHPATLGFDALVEFPPHGLLPRRIGRRLTWLNARHGGAVYDYQDTAAEAIERLDRRQPKAFAHFPGVMPGWDNEARRPGAGTIFHGATPEAYARWLAAACAAAERTLPPDRRLVFINAWNEWAEGAYLEPDRKWGRAFLEATRGTAPRS
ncbi:MAG: glycoside hydrolase family 99-like domain-containing protein [Hyphomonadaceae bacterium]|nr:glycoside hydrolase family 99-like domain-containing protein [Hyphomonadaceae bacterium]